MENMENKEQLIAEEQHMEEKEEVVTKEPEGCQAPRITIIDNRCNIKNLVCTHKKELVIGALTIVGLGIAYKAFKKKPKKVEVQQIIEQIPEKVDKVANIVCDGIPKDAEEILEAVTEEVIE